MNLIISFLISMNLVPQIRVVVLDTGIKSSVIDIPYCEDGKLNRDFTGKGLNDTHGHGTNVSGLIHKKIKNAHRYCQIIVKWYERNDRFNDVYYIKALDYIKTLKYNVLNVSLGGYDTSETILKKLEGQFIKNELDRNVKIIAAAGNQSKNLDEGCHHYPSCHDSRVYVVGAKDEGVVAYYSNYGKNVDEYNKGTNQEAYGIVQTGTSQATANATGEYVNSITNN